MASPRLLAAIKLGLTCCVLVAVASGVGASAAELDPLVLAREVADLGPRTPDSRAKADAVEILRGAMVRAGLRGIRLLPVKGHPGLQQLEGVLPGETGLEVVLTAHLDTVEGSPGAADNAAGCSVAIAVAARLAELPRRHGLRVVLFDGEERGLLGSRDWVASLDQAARGRVLAAANLDLIAWQEGLQGVALPLLSEQGTGLRGPPAWLVAAVLEAGRAVDAPIAVASSSAGVVGQLLTRALDLVRTSDAEALLVAGLPAITLTDAGLFRSDPEYHGPGDRPGRLSSASMADWTDRLGALVLRLDRLAGRPLDDDQYLAFLGRVWSRRSLYWLGLAVWVVLVFQGLPGAWRGVVAAERRRRGQLFLPRFAGRFVFLGCVLMLPVFSSVLLVPAALVASLPATLRLSQSWKLIAASAPLLVTLVGLLVLTVQGAVEAIAMGLPATLLLATGFSSLVWLIIAEDGESTQSSRDSSASSATAVSHSSREL